jgi:hypothetical protein
VQSEQQVAVYGDYAFVVNNIAAEQAPPSIFAYYVNILLGATRPAGAGAATFAWQQATHTWKQLWSRDDVTSTSIVPMISGGSHMAIIDGYFTKQWNDRYHIGLDLDTGKTAMPIRTGTGTDPTFNGMHSPIKADSQGHIMYGMAFGLVRMDTTKMKRVDPEKKTTPTKHD